MEGRDVWVRPWLYRHRGSLGYEVPVLLLDTFLDENAPEDRDICRNLYGGDDAYRLSQEIVLGIGGYRLLRALGFDIETYHMNEGHSALLALELLHGHRRGNGNSRAISRRVMPCTIPTSRGSGASSPPIRRWKPATTGSPTIWWSASWPAPSISARSRPSPAPKVST